MDGVRLAGRRHHHGDHHHRPALGARGVQYRRLYPAAVRFARGAPRRTHRPGRYRHRAAGGDRQPDLVLARRLVARARAPHYRRDPGGDDHRHPLCLGASETCRDRAVADRQGDRDTLPTLRICALTGPVVHDCSQSGSGGSTARNAPPPRHADSRTGRTNGSRRR